jgi:TolB-like protein/DNA-binding winged helix-turn-helix (wHTH) protein/Flp pilus assembly protein TadD
MVGQARCGVSFDERKTLDFRFAGFEIDIPRRELRRASELVPIEPQVFELLVQLVRNHDRIVTKDELIETVWKGRAISEAALSSRISAARRAVGDSGAEQKLIRTLNKRGFRFVGTVQRIVQGTVQRAVQGAVQGAVQATGETTVPVVQQACRRKPETPALTSALTWSERASIAVLPFHNISGDPEQDYLADSIAEDLITGLSRQQWFSVVDHNSSFARKGETVDIRALACELGARYVLEGSVRKAGGRIRVTGQLIDATKRVHIWADRYDSAVADIFVRQDDITSRIVDSVRSQLVMAEAMRLRGKRSVDMDAHDLVTQALPHLWRMSVSEQQRAQTLLQQAAAIKAPQGRAQVHALLGWTYMNMFNLDSHAPIGELTEKALDAGATALALDEQDHWGHLVLGLGHARQRRPDDAVRHLSHCVDINPNFALGHAALGYALACGGQPQRGLEALARAWQLGPLDPFLAIYAPVARYMALFALERYDEAIAVCRSVATRHPHHVGARRLMTVSLGLLGRTDEAKESLAHTLALQPDFSTDHVAYNTVFAQASDRSRFLRGLQKAGLRN